MSDKKSKKPWENKMPASQFDLMRRILAAPSPVGLEGAMTHGVIKPHLEKLKLSPWEIRSFKGNAGIVLDTAPEASDLFSVMVIGHADKIRMQVRSIGDDGKIWLDTDSFLPCTLIGHEVQLFCESSKGPGDWRLIEGGTVEALGAIHFADNDLRSGNKGIKKEMIYLELQLHGGNRKKQVEKLGVKPGDPVLLKRPIRHGLGEDTFCGAYLDNGLGCFVVCEVARLLAEAKGLQNIRFLGACAAYEEIGRFGSRVLVNHYRPDVVIGVDVNHDYDAAPGIADRRFPPLAMGKGFTLSSGSIASATLNGLIQTVARKKAIPIQHDVTGRDTGTDAMAAVLASVDSAATSIGFPIRNMHTISESGHTGDVLAAVHVIAELLRHMDHMNDDAGIHSGDLKEKHPRLDKAR